MLIATLIQRTPWGHHMWWPADGWGWMFFMGIFWLIIIAVVLLLLYRIAQAQGWFNTPDTHGRDRSEAVLRERYARGEIDRETYQRMLADLRE